MEPPPNNPIIVVLKYPGSPPCHHLFSPVAFRSTQHFSRGPHFTTGSPFYKRSLLKLKKKNTGKLLRSPSARSPPLVQPAVTGRCGPGVWGATVGRCGGWSAPSPRFFQWIFVHLSQALILRGEPFVSEATSSSSHFFSGWKIKKKKRYTLPETNSSHLEMDGWNTSLSYWVKGLFSGAFAVSFREGRWLDLRIIIESSWDFFQFPVGPTLAGEPILGFVRVRAPSFRILVGPNDFGYPKLGYLVTSWWLNQSIWNILL